MLLLRNRSRRRERGRAYRQAEHYRNRRILLHRLQGKAFTQSISRTFFDGCRHSSDGVLQVNQLLTKSYKCYIIITNIDNARRQKT